MYRFKIDHSEIRGAIKNFESVKEIDLIKEVNWYINQVYRDLSRRHGTRYSYVTPPATERKNLRVRSRKLLNDLRDSRFTKVTRNKVTAGWDIPEGDPKGVYLGIHVNETGSDRPYRLTPQKAKYTYTTKKGEKRILIPLRAGMGPNGQAKPITGRNAGKFKTMPFSVASSRLDWSGEDTKKFKARTIVIYKISGRRKIPMYIIAKQARIPRRLMLGPAMDKHKDAFFQRIETQIDKALARVEKKRNR